MKKEIEKKVESLMRFIKTLETYDNKKEFDKYCKKKEMKL